MKISPEEYFEAQDFSVASVVGGKNVTPEEHAFLDKYAGFSASASAANHAAPVSAPASSRGPGTEGAGVSVAASVRTPVLPAPVLKKKTKPEIRRGEPSEKPNDTNADASDIATLKAAESLQIISFYLGDQEFTVPSVVVQEVVRSVPLARLPSSSPLVAGAINLRGEVTPVVCLRDILEVNSPRKSEDRFIIICRQQGIQVGLAIERVHTMYRINQKDIDWNIEANLGASVEFVAGLVKLEKKLIGIIHVDTIINSILAEM